jgi:cellobiose phosphorylase
MTNDDRRSDQYPVGLESPSGLRVQVNANGSIRRFDYQDIIVNLFLGNEMEGGPANLYLRRLGESVEATPLLGQRSPAAVRCDSKGLALAGTWQGIRFTASLDLAKSASAWFWHVALENAGDVAATLDLIYAQDLALAHYGAVRLNEYYVSQYLDHTALAHPHRGWVLASRQNQSMGGRNPWCLIGSLGEGVSYATDALQVHGLETRAGRPPAVLREGLPGVRRQHEHGMAAIQDAPVELPPGRRAARGFFGWLEADHPEATSAADLAWVERALALPEAVPSEAADTGEWQGVAASLFSTAPLLEARDLTTAGIAALFGTRLREVEREDGRPLSFFVGERSHVALKAKELIVLRPHGQILRTGGGLTPDEAALTSTCWMAGVFHSMVTQGHVSINRFLSTTHSYLGLFRSHGQRLFAEIDGGWQLLDVPSAFEMRPQGCRWYYRHAGGLIRVESRAPTDRHELLLSVEVLDGAPLRFLLSNHVAINGDDGSDPVPVRYEQDDQGFFIRPIPACDVGRRFPDGGFRLDPLPGTTIERFGGDEVLFADGRSRGQPFLCLVTAPARSIGTRVTGCLVPEPESELMPEERYWSQITAGLRIHPPVGSPLAEETARLAEILPWLAHNALVHYLSPRGLEQYSGGGWGTRDATQGPVEMLLALGRPEPIRALLLRVFRQQNPDGDWPQWFMFFERERNIRPGDSHGDIVFWPLLALAQYLVASGDATFLDEDLPFFHAEGDDRAEVAPIRAHLERALAVIRNRRIPGTALAAYGHGDWNDSLQPVDPAMRERLCSAWTVTLHFHTLSTLAEAFGYLGIDAEAAQYRAMAERVRVDFQRLLIVDDTLTGLADFNDADFNDSVFNDLGNIRYLLHPRDPDTGISYSLLAMVHAIIDGLFTPEQARRHLDLIEAHLLGPDGARLFDRPMAYRGGLQERFQRAESSSFFGREIGVMYTHAHLRYTEALWRYGDAERFFRALCQMNPIGIRDRVPAATPRQANCYYSSSDAAFADRYEAYADYDRALRGEIPLDGGWRVYSSGAGIGTGLILRCLLGLRLERGRLVIDPVMPPDLDGLQAEMELDGRTLEVTYRVRGAGCGPAAVTINGVALAFERGASTYRVGAAEIPLEAFRAGLTAGVNRIDIELGTSQ